jgi:NNP family nitrate/nitrite transporter-like MFS transporter
MVGSFVRPIGGAVADKVGGEKVLRIVLSSVTLLGLWVSSLPALALAAPLLVLLLCSLGTGNGAIFQQVPGQFGQKRMGSITGLMGAAGGLGGFFLPMLLGSLKQHTGSFGWGFGLWGLIAALALYAGWVKEEEMGMAEGEGASS